jgi:hypothetical protein
MQHFHVAKNEIGMEFDDLDARVEILVREQAVVFKALSEQMDCRCRETAPLRTAFSALNKGGGGGGGDERAAIRSEIEEVYDSFRPLIEALLFSRAKLEMQLGGMILKVGHNEKEVDAMRVVCREYREHLMAHEL